MDISRLTQNLMKGLAQKNNAELTALSRVLDVALGKVTTAQVTEVTPVTPQERQALLAKTTEALAELNKLASTSKLTPVAKEEIARLLEQQTLIKSPDLKWANLLVNNRQLLTYTDKPLVAGQTVPVQVSAQQKLVLLDAPESDAPTKNTTSSNSSANSSANVPTTPQKLTSTETTTTATEQKVATKNPTTLSSAPSIPKIEIATVTDTVPITEEERQELLKKTTDELLQLNKVARATSQPIPGLKEAIVSLQQQQAVIKSPDAKWIHIVVNGQPLLTYTDKSLAVGQKVPVQVITPQKIVLLDFPELESVEPVNTADKRLTALTNTINAALTAQKNSIPTYFAKLAITTSPAPATNLPNDTLENTTENISTKTPTSLAATAPAAKVEIATVTETAPMTQKERKELLNKTAEELAQLYKAASNVKQPIPGVKEAIASLLQQQSIIKSPDAKWVHIVVNNQPLLTYSNKPLTTGEKIPVQVVSPQKIALIDLPELDSVEIVENVENSDNLENKLKTLATTINSTLVAQKNATPTYFAKIALPVTASTEQSNVSDTIVDSNSEDAFSIKNPATPTASTPTSKIQSAIVTETAPITPKERQELLTKTNDELAELNKIANTSKQPIPGLKDAISSLLQQQAVIKSPDAKWVHITVNDQPLLTYTNKPLTTGQTIPVQIITPQKIVLLDTPEPNTITSTNHADTTNTSDNKIKTLNTGVSTEKNSAPTYFAKLTLPAESVKPQTATNSIPIDNTLDTKPKAETTPAPKTVTSTTTPTNANTQTATVAKITPITDTERQALLNKITEDLDNINKVVSRSAQTIPSVKEIISTLLEQQTLIKSPNVKSLELSVNNQTITTYTDKPITIGQKLPIQIISSEKVAILDSYELTATTKTDVPVSPKHNASQNQPEKISSKAEPNEDVQLPIPTDNAWKNISNAAQSLLTPTTLEQALKNIAEKIRLQLELTQPKTATENTTKTTSDIKNQPIAKEVIVTEKAVTQTTGSNTANIQKDPQGTSLKLLNEINQVLNGTQKQLSTELTAKLLQQLIPSSPEKNLPEVNNDISTKTSAPQAQMNVAGKSQPTVSTASAQANHVEDIEILIQQLLSKPSNDISQKEVRAQLLQLMQLPSETFEKMDISKLTQHLTQGLEQKNNAELTALSKALNIALGKVVVANVTETAPVTTQERRDLLNKTTEALTQLTKLVSNPAQSTPATTAEISRLQDQQALLKSPDLKWVNLLVNNRPVLTFTDKPITVGQVLPVQLVTAQKLVLLELPQTNTSNDTTKITLTNNATEDGVNTTSPTYSAKSLAQSVLSGLQTTLGEIAAKSANKEALLTPSTTTQTTAPTTNTSATKATPEALLYKAQAEKNITVDTNTQQIKKIIADNLRQLLPHKDIPNLLFSAIQQWQKLPATNQQRLVPITVEQALKSLAEQIRSPLQLTQPKELARIIKDSGIFFENKLNAAQTEIPAEGKSNPNIEKTFSHDLKGSLLTLLSKVNQELNGNNKPLTTEQTAKLLQQLSSFIPTAPSATTTQATTQAATPTSIDSQDIQLFMQELMNKPVKELSNKELRTQLLVLMQQHSIHGLAKIQLQQLASLNHELSTRDSNQPSSSLQIDIPVKHHNDVQHVHVRIDRDWVDERHASSEESKTSTKVKQWSVTLRFDLPTLGEFCAQLAIIDTTVSATLWAAQEKTFAHVRDKMNDLQKNLEKEGIHVKQLQCMKGMPPEKPIALSYSLIDVST